METVSNVKTKIMTICIITKIEGRKNVISVFRGRIATAIILFF